MWPFESLPQEVNDLIIEELLQHAELETLSILSRISKSFRRVFEPFIQADPIELDEEFCVRAVLDKRYASIIRVVHVERVLLDSMDVDLEEVTLAEALGKSVNSFNDRTTFSRLKTRVHEIFQGDAGAQKRWVEQIRRLDPAYFIALGLAHLPNLRRIHLSTDERDDWLVMDEIYKQMMADERIPMDEKPFQRIKDVFISRGNSSTLDAVPACLSTVASWPNLRKIRAADVRGASLNDVARAKLPKIPPRADNLIDICLSPHCKVPPFLLRRLLFNAPCLRRFKYHLGDEYDHEAIDAGAVQDALDCRRDSLEHLTLWLDPSEVGLVEDEWSHERGMHSDWPQMDFSSFERLQYLSVSPHLIFGRHESYTYEDDDGEEYEGERQALPQVLPSCIRTLVLAGLYSQEDAKRIGDGLREICEQKADFSHLRNTEISILVGYYKGTEDLDDLIPVGAEVGIKVVISKCMTTGLYQDHELLIGEENFERQVLEVEMLWGNELREMPYDEVRRRLRNGVYNE